MPTPVQTPTLTPPGITAAQPGSSFQTAVKNPTSQPMEVRINTQTLNGKHCGITTVNNNVAWAKVSSPSTFQLAPGASRTLTVNVAPSGGPPGTNDLIVAGTHVAPPLPGQETGATFSATVGFQIKVTYPGQVTVNNAPCKAIGPSHKHAGAAPPAVVHTESSLSPFVYGGIALAVAAILALVVYVIKLRKAHRQ